ncbi:MAG TPA: hypothetical protein VIK01_02030 [Polyangiaceae bacterium]
MPRSLATTNIDGKNGLYAADTKVDHLRRSPTPPARRPAQSNSGWVDDAHIAQTIVEGGVAVKLSAGMAPNPDLKDKPEVVAELIKIVRKFGE